MVGQERTFSLSNYPNWNFEADDIAVAGFESPMDDRLYAGINGENIKFIAINISLALLQRTAHFLSIFSVNVVASGDPVHANPRNLYSINVRFHICCE